MEVIIAELKFHSQRATKKPIDYLVYLNIDFTANNFINNSTQCGVLLRQPEKGNQNDFYYRENLGASWGAEAPSFESSSYMLIRKLVEATGAMGKDLKIKLREGLISMHSSKKH